MSRGHDLLALQARDERIASLRREIAGLDAALRGDETLDRLREEAGAASSAHRAAELAGRAVERELAGVRQRARQLEKRLYDGSVRNPQDLLGLQRDLEALRPRIDELEARLLEAMEANEGAEAALSQARGAVAVREGEVSAAEQPRRLRLEAARSELAEVEAERAAEAAALDPADLGLYARVSARRQPAVVVVSDGACGGCHLPLSVREISEIRHGDGVVQCSRCDRVVTG